MNVVQETHQQDAEAIRLSIGDATYVATHAVPLRPPSSTRRKVWTPGDWACATVLIGAMIWLLIEVLPAFFDGRVAQAVR